MSQQEFYLLSKRYLAGECSPEEEKLLAEWYESPANQTDLNLSQTQKSGIERRIWRNIRQQTRPSLRARRIRLIWISAVAASLVIGWLWSGTFSLSPQSETALASDNQRQEAVELNSSAELEKEVLLPDGTKVTLGRNSRLTYGPSFNHNKREVHLVGEGYFQVKRDVTKPFVVYAGQLVTEVLGTSFRVRQNGGGKTTEVSVREGKVSVYAEESKNGSHHNGVIITQNQKVLFDATTRNIVPGIVDMPLPVVIPEQAAAVLVFHETAFEEVLAELQRLYGIEFVISNPAVKDCLITADLHELSLFTQLDLLCKSVGASYDKRGTVVFISGDGC